MRIRQIRIRNFRGIKTLDWSLPDRTVICLLGEGDSTKSTILEALRRAFHPHWKLDFTDADFHHGNTLDELSIEVTVGDLSAEFISVSKFGHQLRGWDKERLQLTEEPEENESVLTIELRVGQDWQPRWRVINSRKPEMEFRPGDRAKVGLALIGTFSDRQLSWSPGTPLSKLTDVGELSASLADAGRHARFSLDAQRADSLKPYDEMAKKAEISAKKLGVRVATAYKAHLDFQAIDLGGLALHDGEMPLRLLGTGSRRMLLCGIQQSALDAGHITLIDE